MTEAKIEKKILREEVLSERDSLNWSEILEKSRRIKESFLALPEVMKADTIALYASKGSEVFTHDLIRELLPRKTVVLPKVENARQRVMKLAAITTFEELSPGFMGVLEPLRAAKFVEKSAVDVVAVPVVGFDENLNRLGHGMGFYDVFLKGVEAVKIGLAFESQKLKRIPVSEHDVPLDIVVTEKKVYR
ncbi:5-formyltetrahydrofolate cyclo-ligase [Candidatus Woesearchaeota archaeon]|nr:MAG: 5-formyltetrahydrofolate cyclo-ligase [Candidatus Woesearchaeota archaeon]